MNKKKKDGETKKNKTEDKPKYHLSYSKYRSLTKCPFYYHTHYKERVRRIKMPVKVKLGSAIHDTLEFYYDPSLNNNVKDALQYFIALWNGITKEEMIDYGQKRVTKAMAKENEDLKYDTYIDLGPEDFKQKGLDMLSVYFKEYYDEDWSNVVVEQEFLDSGLNLAGRIDMVATDKDDITYLIDHKTLGRQANLTQFMHDGQIKSYTIGADNLKYDIDKIMINIIYRKKEPSVERLVFDPPAEKELNEFQKELKEVGKVIETDVKYKNQGFHCQSCFLREYCRKEDGYKSKFYKD